MSQHPPTTNPSRPTKSDDAPTKKPVLRSGEFVRAELATGKKALATGFYGQLFGWRAVPADGFAGGGYEHLVAGTGAAVGGIYELTAKAQGELVPPHWVYAVTIDEGGEGGLADALLRAEAAGGTVVQPPFEIFGQGRLSLVQDPTGALIQLFEPDVEQAALSDSGQELGEFTWHELATRSLDDAARFYAAVFKWERRDEDRARGGMRYAGFVKNGRAVGGMIELGANFRSVPSHWLGYVHVEDIEQASDLAVVGGARLLMPRAEVEGVGAFAVLNDPTGAPFGLFAPILKH